VLRFRASICLAVFLLSTVGTYASVHHCNGELTGVAFVSVAECEHEVETEEEALCDMNCCGEEDDHSGNENDDDCCDTTVLKDNIQYSTSNFIWNCLTQIAIIQPNFVFFFLSDILDNKDVVKEYSPPNFEKDVIVDIQSFLI
jgi:hypothetical protein